MINTSKRRTGYCIRTLHRCVSNPPSGYQTSNKFRRNGHHSNSRYLSTPNGTTVAGGHGVGCKLNQLSQADGFYVDDNQTVHVADLECSRIMSWPAGAKEGKQVVGGKVFGKTILPLYVTMDRRDGSYIICDLEVRQVFRWHPHIHKANAVIISDITCAGMTMDDRGFLYVCDAENDEVRRWQIGDKQGTLVAGGNGKGDRLDQVNVPTGVFVDRDYNVYVADKGNARVMKWKEGAQEGVLVAGGNGEGNATNQLNAPWAVVIDTTGAIYVSDCVNARIMRWYEGDAEGVLMFGGNGEGNRTDQLYLNSGMAVDRHGYLYVADSENARVQRFEVPRP